MGRTFAATCLASFAVAFVAIVMLKGVSHRLGLIDRPGGRFKIHQRPVPFTGGVGVVAGTMAGMALSAAAPESLAQLMALLLPAVAVACMGLYDDVHGLSAATRLWFEGIAAAVAGAIGVVTGLFAIDPSAPAAQWVALSILLLAIVGNINALNMQDGMDGHAGSLALISSLGIALASNQAGWVLMTALGLALAGALGAFLCFNFPPASVFLGDNGSYFVGFLVGAGAAGLAIKQGTPAGYAGAVLLVGIPVIDTAYAIVRRLRRGQSPFRSDRDHFYDQLLRRGVPTKQTIAIASGVQVMMVIAGVLILGSA